MNEFIEVINQIKPKNNLNFPIADTIDLIGGYIQVNLLDDMYALPDSKKRDGMLCYVKENDVIYKLCDNKWDKFQYCNIQLDLETEGGQLTEEQYNDVLKNDIFLINNSIALCKDIKTNNIYVSVIINSTLYVINIAMDESRDWTIFNRIDLSYFIPKSSIVQHTGEGEQLLMSQKAVTHLINPIQNYLSNLIGSDQNLTIMQISNDVVEYKNFETPIQTIESISDFYSGTISEFFRLLLSQDMYINARLNNIPDNIPNNIATTDYVDNAINSAIILSLNTDV